MRTMTCLAGLLLLVGCAVDEPCVYDETRAEMTCVDTDATVSDDGIMRWWQTMFAKITPYLGVSGTYKVEGYAIAQACAGQQRSYLSGTFTTQFTLDAAGGISPSSFSLNRTLTRPPAALVVYMESSGKQYRFDFVDNCGGKLRGSWIAEFVDPATGLTCWHFGHATATRH